MRPQWAQGISAADAQMRRIQIPQVSGHEFTHAARAAQKIKLLAAAGLRSGYAFKLSWIERGYDFVDS